MFVFLTLLAVVTASAIWATEKVDRPRRQQAQLDRVDPATSR